MPDMSSSFLSAFLFAFPVLQLWSCFPSLVDWTFQVFGQLEYFNPVSYTHLKLDDAREEVEKLARKQAEAENEFRQLGMKEDMVKFKKMG